MEAKLQQQKNDMQDKMRDKENKLKRLAEIFNSNEQNEQRRDHATHNATTFEPQPAPRSMADIQSVYHTPSRAHRVSYINYLNKIFKKRKRQYMIFKQRVVYFTNSIEGVSVL